MSINWNSIRSFNNSQNDGFEELIKQLARREDIEGKSSFVPLGKPDAGVECYWILANGDEWGWQAKFFTSSLGSTQWGEIDHSVKTAIEKRPKLKKYFIAMPIDPPDARLEKTKSLLDKWNERVEKWQKWAGDKDLVIEFVPWWSSDIFSKLSRPENIGLTRFFFGQDEFTQDWFFEQTEMSILELGNRYTPELNVKLDVSEVFNAIARNEKFEKKILSVFDEFFIRSKKINIFDKNLEDNVSELKSIVKQFYEIVEGCNFQGVDILPYTQIDSLLIAIVPLVEGFLSHFVELEREVQEEKKEYSYYHKYGSEIQSLRRFSASLENVRNFIFGVPGQLSNNPILLIDGDAGVGKSHLIADVVINRNTQRELSLFLLGQHFVTEEDPWIQINKKINYRGSFDEFLGALNSKAETMGSRIVIFIDAINEGKGKYFWGDNIKSFIKKIKKHEWLGLVISIRTSYKELVFPDYKWNDENIVEYTHYGFRDIEYDAVKIFFDGHNIQQPTVPLLHPEFQNPLFLKLFCEGLHKLGYTKVPDGFQGITSVIDFFIDSTNLRLSKPFRLDYPSSINVVKKVVNGLISEKIDKKTRYIPYEAAFKIADEVLINFSSKRGLLEELISEGVLSKNIFWKSDKSYEEGVYLAYERFEDHLTADYLINDVINSKTSLSDAFSIDGKLFPYVKDEVTCRLNQGLIEAFSIQLPEKAGVELYELTPHLEGKLPIVESFVQSLPWRKIETTSEKLRDYVNRFVLKYQLTSDLFWETIISLAAIPDHYFNAYSLHKHLTSFNLADRDATWTIRLTERYSVNAAALRLVDWAWSTKNKNYISDESLQLSAIALAWFHTSIDRELRDSATKGLVCLLEGRIDILINVLKKFENIDDPYVYERLLAVAYGCALRTAKKNDLRNLSKYIYETIFNTKGEVYPHILLRDYARGVLEYVNFIGVIDDVIDMRKVRPPYNSLLNEQYPSREELDSKYYFDYEADDFKDYCWAQNSILSSMTTEYGKGVGGYGDFGRYVFQYALEHWDVDADALSNLAVKLVFEKYGYNVEKHGKFDRKIGSGRARDTYPKERIGKKYQWLAFYEILAKVSDNHIKNSSWGSEKNPEVYDGPWEPDVRDIDPTVLIKNTGNYNEEEPATYWWSQEHYSKWDIPNEDWIEREDDLPSLENLININDLEGEEWLTLQSYPEWGEPKTIGVEKYDRPQKRLWFHIRSYLVKNDDYETVKSWLERQSFMGNWMPESYQQSSVFSREYYWSPAYHYFQNDDEEGGSWRKLKNRLDDDAIAFAIVTSDNYFWDKGTDNSKKETINYLKPCIDIFEKMKMIYPSKEGELVDANGKLLCFDSSVYHDSKPQLLIRKREFLSYLDENGLKVIWTVLGEKGIIGGWHSARTNNHTVQEINGVYYLNNTLVEGKIISKFT